MNKLDEDRARGAIANRIATMSVPMPATTAQMALEALERAGFKLVRTEVLEALRDRAREVPDG